MLLVGGAFAPLLGWALPAPSEVSEDMTMVVSELVPVPLRPPADAAKTTFSDGSEAPDQVQNLPALKASTTIQALPNELLHKIFGTIPWTKQSELRLTCQRFKSLVDDTSYPINKELESLWYSYYKGTRDRANRKVVLAKVRQDPRAASKFFMRSYYANVKTPGDALLMPLVQPLKEWQPESLKAQHPILYAIQRYGNDKLAGNVAMVLIRDMITGRKPAILSKSYARLFLFTRDVLSAWVVYSQFCVVKRLSRVHWVMFFYWAQALYYVYHNSLAVESVAQVPVHTLLDENRQYCSAMLWYSHSRQVRQSVLPYLTFLAHGYSAQYWMWATELGHPNIARLLQPDENTLRHIGPQMYKYSVEAGLACVQARLAPAFRFTVASSEWQILQVDWLSQLAWQPQAPWTWVPKDHQSWWLLS
ncbi:hypothetical protein H4R34_000952 [Dimargaris verticillata]|uniref:F-box domain-containing protein n=1 Tax=Dimargaris verticillata TaxID=2761393 RepID=A0A9W8EEY1_9FUNG|nr:hypothetical protein H4R34_000952 [Dimargaris verticillata]